MKRSGDAPIPERQCHEQARELPETLCQKRRAQHTGFMRQKLRFNALNSRRLLQRADHMHRQPVLHSIALEANGIVSIKIADDALAAFIHKERVPAYAPVFHCGIPGKNLGIDIPENHLGGGPVVP